METITMPKKSKASPRRTKSTPDKPTIMIGEPERVFRMRAMTFLFENQKEPQSVTDIVIDYSQAFKGHQVSVESITRCLKTLRDRGDIIDVQQTADARHKLWSLA